MISNILIQNPWIMWKNLSCLKRPLSNIIYKNSRSLIQFYIFDGLIGVVRTSFPSNNTCMHKQFQIASNVWKHQFICSAQISYDVYT